jgi:hypothetical protein
MMNSLGMLGAGRIILGERARVKRKFSRKPIFYRTAVRWSEIRTGRFLSAGENDSGESRERD